MTTGGDSSSTVPMAMAVMATLVASATVTLYEVHFTGMFVLSERYESVKESTLRCASASPTDEAGSSLLADSSTVVNQGAVTCAMWRLQPLAIGARAPA